MSLQKWFSDRSLDDILRHTQGVSWGIITSLSIGIGYLLISQWTGHLIYEKELNEEQKSAIQSLEREQIQIRLNIVEKESQNLAARKASDTVLQSLVERVARTERMLDDASDAKRKRR